MPPSWISATAVWLDGEQPRKARHRNLVRPRLQVEPLEDRWLPAPYVVDTVEDDANAHSLRKAIDEVNLGHNDGITFNIGDGEKTITIKGTPLPDITKTVTIDGTTRPGQLIMIKGETQG